jgi:hypothetical protein
MRHPRRLIGSFLAATVLVDLAMLAVGPDLRGPSLSGAMAVGLCFSQISTAAIWLALGQTAIPLRIVLALLILIAWTANLLGMVVWHEDWREIMLLTGMLAGAVVAPLIALRPLGLRVSRRSFSNGAATALNGRQPLQFSIRYMLGLMTALAVVLGTLKWTVSFELLPLHRLVEPELAILAAGRGLVAWAALWAALGNRWTAVRMIVFVAAIVASYGGLLLSSRSYYYDYDFWFFAWLFSLEALLLFSSLWVFRVAGYRVGIWKTQDEEAAASNGAAEGRATGQ